MPHFAGEKGRDTTSSDNVLLGTSWCSSFSTFPGFNAMGLSHMVRWLIRHSPHVF